MDLSSVSRSKWEVARFVLDWSLILIPGGAIFSGVRKASYIRTGYIAVKAAPKGTKLTALEAYVVGKPIRSALVAGASAGTAWNHPATNPLYYQIKIAGVHGDYIIGQYIDREGVIRTFLPSGQIMSGLRDTSRTGTEARSFYDMNGLGLLKSMGTPTPESPRISSTSGRRKASQRSRGPKGRRSRGNSRRPSPWCWRHKRRHFCKYTRKR